MKIVSHTFAFSTVISLHISFEKGILIKLTQTNCHTVKLGFLFFKDLEVWGSWAEAHFSHLAIQPCAQPKRTLLSKAQLKKDTYRGGLTEQINYQLY